MGSSSEDIDLSIANIYRCWRLFRRGKKAGKEIHAFQYDLESNLLTLALDLQRDKYNHGHYRSFVVNDSKKRLISVASVRDRIVHRMLYEYLQPVWDSHFSYDVWSCRPDKGLIACANRVQDMMSKYKHRWLWRSDISKFFDNVEHGTLKICLEKRSCGVNAKKLLDKVINSYSHNRSVSQSRKGLPIGNLTSQIFANIYLNEFDRYVLHKLKPSGYIRYGDDFVVFTESKDKADKFYGLGQNFLRDSLSLALHPSNNCIQPARKRLHFLGLEFWPNGRRLDKRMRSRLNANINLDNFSSYRALVSHHGNNKGLDRLDRKLIDMLDGVD